MGVSNKPTVVFTGQGHRPIYCMNFVVLHLDKLYVVLHLSENFD